MTHWPHSRDAVLEEAAKVLDAQAYVLECCDTTNDYAEAQKVKQYAKAIRALKENDAPQRSGVSDAQSMSQLPCDQPARASSGHGALPLDPTPAMIEAGAQRLVRWETGQEKWPDAWSKLDVRAARNDAERCWRSMWLADQENNAAPQATGTGATDTSEKQEPAGATPVVTHMGKPIQITQSDGAAPIALERKEI